MNVVLIVQSWRDGLQESDLKGRDSALHADEWGNHWRVPTFAVLDAEAAELSLWEGPILTRAGTLESEGCPLAAHEVGEAYMPSRPRSSSTDPHTRPSGSCAADAGDRPEGPQATSVDPRLEGD